MALKSAAVQIALVALVLRAILPAGWMPNSHGGASPLMPCPGMMQAMAMPGAHREMPQNQDRKSTYCACAAVAQISTLAGHVAAPAPSPGASVIAFDATHDAPAIASAYRANAARAPPAST